MPAERQTSFIGICVRLADSAARIDVRMQRHGTTIRDVSGSSRLLFPPTGEVELADAAGSLAIGDWVAFHVVSDAPQGASVPRVTEYRRLLPLEDFSELGSSEKARRLLVEDGRADSLPGEIMARLGEREMVRLKLVRESDGLCRAAATEPMRSLPVWRFDPKLCIPVAGGTQPASILDPSERFAQVGTLDWSRDADFVRRIIRSLTRAEAGEDEALRRFAEALGRFADGLERGAARRNLVDARVAQEILRIRDLASMLREEQDVLAAYYEALRDDPEVESLLEIKVGEVAQQTIEAERNTIVERLTAEFEQDLAAMRAERVDEIRNSVRQLGGEMARELERRRSVRLAEFETELAERRRQGREELDATLGRERAALEADVASFSEQRVALFNQVELLGQRERDLSASIEALSGREAEVEQKLELLRSQREAEIRKSTEELGVRMTRDLERRIAAQSAELEARLSEREREGRQALETSLGTNRAALEAAVARLEDRHLVLGNAIEILERRERELSASVDGLSFKEASELDAMELRRAEREAELKKSLEILSVGMMSDLERRIAARSAELEAELSDRERQAHQALESSLGTKRKALESEVSNLEDRRVSLGTEIAGLEQRARELSASVEGLAAREAAVFADLEQRSAQREAEVKKSLEELSARMMEDVEGRAAARSAELEADIVARELQAREALEAALAEKRSSLEAALTEQRNSLEAALVEKRSSFEAAFAEKRSSCEAELSELERRRDALESEIAGLERRAGELSASIDSLGSREARLVQELEQRRAQREADVKKSVEELSAGMIGDLERRLAARTGEFEADFAQRKKQTHAALDASLGARRAELRADVAKLDERHAVLSAEIEQMQRRERELIASLEDLSSREASAVQSVAKLSRRILEEAPHAGRPPAAATGS
jgi:chromosome segregation ATPase